MKCLLLLGLIAPFAICAQDAAAEYISKMCFPTVVNTTAGASSQNPLAARLLAYENSPFPCERSTYLENVCLSNGTETIDFIAEQECLCNGGYFSAVEGCDACQYAHGLVTTNSPEEAASSLSSISAAECTPNPPTQGFTNLFAPINTMRTTLSETISNDKFPNQTAVSNYFTTTIPLTPGEVTGGATARLTSYTNTGNVRFTPTSSLSSGSPTTSANNTSSGAFAKGVPIAGGFVVTLCAMSAIAIF
jgi:hypothetical protein